MTCRQRDSIEMFCLQQLANLDELEGPWAELMAIGDPTGAALALRLFGLHLMKTGSMLVALEQSKPKTDCLQGSWTWDTKVDTAPKSVSTSALFLSSPEIP